MADIEPTLPSKNWEGNQMNPLPSEQIERLIDALERFTDAITQPTNQVEERGDDPDALSDRERTRLRRAAHRAVKGS